MQHAYHFAARLHFSTPILKPRERIQHEFIHVDGILTTDKPITTPEQLAVARQATLDDTVADLEKKAPNVCRVNFRLDFTSLTRM
jgi:hypothetical protein